MALPKKANVLHFSPSLLTHLMMAGEACISSSRRYTYTHEDKVPVDAHHLSVRSTSPNLFLISALLLPLASFYLHFSKGTSIYISLWSIAISALLVRLSRKHVVKESIIIIRAFGVQLETHYKSGRTDHLFFPIDKILKPVLTECVTPVTCYWSLSLIVREAEELVLVFKGTRPPLKMLIPIWKALCAATNCPGSVDEFRQIGMSPLNNSVPTKSTSGEKCFD